MPDTAQLHADQIAYWNGPGAASWIAAYARREHYLKEIAAVILERAAPQPGAAVVDIGCGSGGTSLELVKRVGPAGQVLAVDVSAPILAFASETLADYPNARAVVADAAAYPFPSAAADLLFSRFGVMFFGDPVAAFANLRKALKPTGRMVFACWRDPAENPWMMTPVAAAARLLPPTPKPNPEDPGPFAFGSRDRVTRILTEAGFKAPVCEKIDMMIDLAAGQGLEAAVAGAVDFGPVTRLLEDQPPAIREAVTESIRDVLAPYEANGSVNLPGAIWIVQAAA